MSDLRSMVLETLSQIDEQNISEKIIANDRDALSASLIDEREFLNTQREKLLFLFEGLLDVDINDLEKKLELTLRFLQFQLAEIDKRLNEI